VPLQHRSHLLALLPVIALFAQPPEPEAPPRRAPAGGPVLEDRVDLLLKDWCRQTELMQSFYVEFMTKERDQQFGDVTHKSGSARFLRLTKKLSVARLDIRRFEDGKTDPKSPKSDPEAPEKWPLFESFILTENRDVYQFDYRGVGPANDNPAGKQGERKQQGKKITKYPGAAIVGEDGLGDGPLPFLMCGDPDKAKARYLFKILAENEKAVEIEIIPRFEDDKQNFSLARVTLDKSNFLPTRLYIKEPNGNDSVSSMTRRDVNPDLPQNNFVVDEAKFRARGFVIEVNDRVKGRGEETLRPAGGGMKPLIGNRKAGEAPRR
jgi:hypothetical protein